jgi:hypothetical protein
MKKLFLLPLFAFAAMTASAQVPAPTTSGMERDNGPIMTFTELTYDFGTIKQGEIVTHVFKFKNTGKEPLIINSANGSCGCTVPVWPQEPIKPNGDGEIKVTFNSTGKMGQQDKTVTIMYDTDKQIVLHMKGNVEAATATPAPQGGTGTAATPAGGTPAPAPASPAPAQKAPAPKAPAAKPTVTAPAPKNGLL